MNHSPDICDDIEWFVDVCGLVDVVLELLRKGDAITVKEGRVSTIYLKTGKDSYKSEKAPGSGKIYAPPGLIFDGSHWYHKKRDGEIVDSYDTGVQIKGTAHFCQTFAIMSYLNKTEMLKKGEYTHNIEVAVDFWKHTLSSNENIRDIFLNEVTEYWGVPSKDTGIKKIQTFCVPLDLQLKKMNWEYLQQYMNWVKNNAKKFINCKQG